MATIDDILADGVPVNKAALRDYLAHREQINVLDFGADPSGARDAGSAIQAAIDAASGRTVRVPEGRYRIETPILYRAPAIVDGHIPGLRLVGAGARLTRFDCHVRAGAALRIDQALGYTFSQNGLIEGIELVGAADGAEEDGIYLSGAWHYRFADLRIRHFGRHGITCPYRRDLGYVLTDVAIRNGSDRLARPAGGFMTRLRPGDRIAAHGLAEPATVVEVIDDVTIRVSTPAVESATVDVTFGGNTDAFQTILDLERCNIEDNGGWGIDGSGGLGLLLSWIDSAVQECRQGGVRVGGGTRLNRGIIAANGRDGDDGAAGLHAIRAPGTPQLLHLENIEFDSNHGVQLWLQYAANARCYQCRFISHAHDGTTMVPETGVLFGGRDGGAGNARNIALEQCAWRADAQHALAFRAIAFGTVGTYDAVRVTDPLWITLTPPHQLKYAPQPHPDSAVRIVENGAPILAAGSARPTLVMRKRRPQTLSPGVDTLVAFEPVVQAGGFTDTRAPLAHAYWLEVAFAVTDLERGEEVAISLVVDGAVWRQGVFGASGLPRETFQLSAVAPLPAGAEIGVRARVRAAGARTIVGEVGLASLSVVALT